MICRFLLSLGSAAALTVWSAIATAAPVVYFGENQAPALTVTGSPKTAHDAFVSNLTGVGTETFETKADGSVAPVVATFAGSTGNITATINGTGAIRFDDALGSPSGRFNTTGAEAAPVGGTYWRSDGAWTITFDTAISAFGFYGTDIGDFDGQIEITLTDANDVATVLVVNNTVNGADGALLFWGFLDSGNSYKSIAFGNTAAGVDFFGFDDMIIGDRGQITTVPTPGTLALVGLALAAAAVARRRKT